MGELVAWGIGLGLGWTLCSALTSVGALAYL